MATTREPFPTNPEDFDDDVRIAFDKILDTYVLEDTDGTTWEWLGKRSKWVPTVNQEEIEAQQAIYKVPGVDEDEPALDPVAKKRKLHEDGAEQVPDSGPTVQRATKKPKSEEPHKERANTAIYVTGLPKDADVDEVYDRFRRYGVIAESLDNNEPRIKLYSDEAGQPKGEALIIYLQAHSVKMAIQMADESDFRNPLASGSMRVTEADSSYKYQQEQPLATETAKKKGSSAYRDREKVIKKNEAMRSRLADWDDDDPQTLVTQSSRHDKTVVLKKMFTLDELKEDPLAASEIIEDIREEATQFGKVINVTLYDKEPDGVATIRFNDPRAARACMNKFDGRFFDKRRIEAYIADGTEQFEKTAKTDVSEEDRLKQFTEDVEKGGKTGGPGGDGAPERLAKDLDHGEDE